MVAIVRRTPHPESILSDDIHPILKRIYAGRGVISTTELNKHLQHLLPFHQLSGIEAAVQCLYTAITEQKSILIVGDFDADGATSTALAVTALIKLGAKKVDYLVPNRFEYGYGLTPEIVAVAQEFHPDILMTVDNGITSIAGVKAAKLAGMQVIITDHHLSGAELPAADAIVNPNLPEDKFSSKNLAGVGVVFYLMLALRSFLREKNYFASQQIDEPNMAQFLDLVALGTVADVVPLDSNNRILVYQGLQRIRAGTARPGIKALLDIAGKNPANLSAADLGFSIAPRLNAAGRLDDMSLGITGLLTEDYSYALQVAQQLDQLNDERRLIETDMQKQAAEQLKQMAWDNLTHSPAGICLFNPHWHQGVIGILASRIKDKLYRPVVVFARGNETELKGSARSIPGLHIRDVFQLIDTKYPGIILKFGGHAMAAGITLEEKNLNTFTKAFADEVATLLDEHSLKKIIYSDGSLDETLANLNFVQLLRDIEPWGQAFPEPSFDDEFRLIDQRLVGEKHLKMRVAWLGQNKAFDAIAFNVDLEQWPNYRCEKIRMVYKLDINEYNGRFTVQLIVSHMEV